MNLKDIRMKFRDLSGRYDLVNEDSTDNGADFFINEASRWLDRSIETQKSWATRIQLLSSGNWYVKFPFARAIKEVYLSTVESRWQLEKKNLQDLIAGYLNSPPSLWTSEAPLYFSPAITRYIPETITAATLATFSAYLGTIPPTNYQYNAILLSSPVDQNTVVEINGLFYSIALEQDADENYWSSMHPLLLIQASIRMTYVVSGNKAMTDMIDRGLDGDLIRIDKDLVEELIAEVDEMEG